MSALPKEIKPSDASRLFLITSAGYLVLRTPMESIGHGAKRAA
jgi:hypothetical protein